MGLAYLALQQDAERALLPAWLTMGGLLVYIASLAVVISFVTLIFFVFLAPSFVNLFDTSSAQLPSVTAALLTGHSRWLFVAVPWAIFGMVAWIYLSGKRVVLHQRLPQPALLRVPALGSILRPYLDWVYLACVRLFLSLEIDGRRSVELTDEVFASGDGLSGERALTPDKSLLRELRGAVALGTLDAELAHRQAQLAAEYPARLAAVRVMLSLFVHVVLGIVVGLLVAALYLPIFRMWGAVV